MTWALANWKWLLIGVLVAVLLGQRVQVSNAQARTSRAELALAEYKTSVADAARLAQQAADKRLSDQQEQQRSALDEARTREADARGAADALRLERGRLLDAIATATARRNLVPGPAATAQAQPADPVADVLGQCTAEVQELAGAADAHASDAKLLIDAWPR